MLPEVDGFDLSGLDIPQADLDLLFSVDADIWRQEAALVPSHLETFGEHTPTELWDEYRNLVNRLG